MHYEPKYEQLAQNESILQRIEFLQKKKENYSKLTGSFPQEFIDMHIEHMDKRINELWGFYMAGKKFIRDLKEEVVEVLDFDDIYKDITNTIGDKKAFFIKHLGEEACNRFWDKKVRCMHCEKEFLINDYKAVVSRDDPNDVWIFCKTKGCDGGYIDWWPIKKK